MYDSPNGRAVRDTLQTIGSSSAEPTDEDRAALRAHVCAAVAELRGWNWPIERILVRLKQLAMEVEYAGDEPGASRERLIAEMVHWCIEEYYS